MANENHLARLRQDVNAWNEWREKNSNIQPDLGEADLREADLSGANLSGAHLNRAHLNSADLTGADLSGADLSKADLSWANISSANLGRANLSEALLISAIIIRTNLSEAVLREAALDEARLHFVNLSRADLSRASLTAADFSGVDLSQADLSGARIGNTSFSDVALNEVIGLDTVDHLGPSSIGIDTIYRSQGNISEVFLRGCGLPDTFITYIRSLTEKPIQFYSCFISYSSKDDDFAKRLHADLQDRGVRCWFAPEDIEGGKKTHEQIDQAILKYDKLLLVLSEHSMKSQWVEFEIRKARKQEVQKKKRVLFPIRLVSYKAIKEWECFDADTKKDLATEIREYYIPDFSDWKNPAAYKKEFDRLLRDLKAEDETASMSK